jgi:chromosome segregation ATPase
MTIDLQFNTINNKLQQLVKQHHRVKKENEQLRKEIRVEKEKHSKTDLKIEDLQQQLSVLKFGANEMNDKDKKDFERKINQYIKEIDKCIAYLSE